MKFNKSDVSVLIVFILILEQINFSLIHTSFHACPLHLFLLFLLEEVLRKSQFKNFVLGEKKKKKDMKNRRILIDWLFLNLCLQIFSRGTFRLFGERNTLCFSLQ